MATRLDRLWVLLDSGSTQVTRKAAADQIGEVQKLHPHELHNLLRKVRTYLTSKSWDTRIAAGQAVEAIARNVKKWQPSCQPNLEGDEKSPPPDVNDTLLAFDSFNIRQVLTHGTPLLSSTGDEYQSLESDPEYQRMTAQERVAFHRQQLRQRLGLVAQGKVFSTGMEGLFEDSDLVVTTGESKEGNTGNRAKTPEVRELNALQLSGMSARERNRAKRKAKQMARRSSKDTDAPERNDAEPPAKKPRTTSVVVEQAGQSDKLLIDQVTDTESSFDESEEWPFTWFCEEMFRNLFNPSWEVRHGAATALREIIKLHGETAGISVYTQPDKHWSENQKWLVDAAIRVMCVFALDRFADFVSDQVVAPVRATCAQVLGVVVRVMCVEHVDQVVAVLLTLVGQERWEVRHASLMGIQHLLAARTDLSESLLPLPLLSSSILRGLQDVDDDVRAVAASALLPVASQLHRVLPGKLTELLQILWDSLLDLDDLSASTNSIMELLCILLSCKPSVNGSTTAADVQTSTTVQATVLQQSTATFVPRLWPFLSHTISSVRSSCLKVILTLLKNSNEDLMKQEGEGKERGGESKSGGGEVGDGGGKGEGEGDSESSFLGWLRENLQGMLCQTFQRFALEGEESIRDLVHQVWVSILAHSTDGDLVQCSTSLVTPWLCLLMSPSSTPIETSLLVSHTHTTQTVYLGGCLGVESLAVREQAAFVARVAGARALGLLASQVGCHGDSDSPLTQLSEGLRQMLAGNSATHKMVAALVVSFWKHCPGNLVPQFTAALTEQGVYEEIMPFLLSLQKDCHGLIVVFEKKGLNVAKGINPSGYTAEFAAQLATTTYESTIPSLKLSNSEKQEFDSLRRSLLTSLGQLQEEHQRMQTRVHCCMAGTLVTLTSLPPKLNPIIRPLMDCIKTESNTLMQSLSAKWLGQLLDICKSRSPCPNPKIIKNLCSFACCDPQHTPPIKPSSSPDPSSGQVPMSKSATPTSEEPPRLESWEWNTGIITLVEQRRPTSQRVHHGRGRPSAAVREAMAAAAEQEHQKPLEYQRRGAESALTAVASHFGSQLFTALPQLWSHVTQPLQSLPIPREKGEVPPDDVCAQAQSVVASLQALEIMAPSVDPSLKPQLLYLLPLLLTSLCSHFTAVRHMAARCIATLAQVDLHQTMEFLVNSVLPYLSGDTVIHRQGAIEAMTCVLESAGLDALCYVVLLLMPVLGRMSDQQEDIRRMASQCFATLVTLMPLELRVQSPPEMSSSLAEQREQQRTFLEQLLDTSKLENYTVPIPIKADLRKYQQDGINWLAFLNKYKLHGILCDDMGLGKTLQSLCIMAGDHHHRVREVEVNGSTTAPPSLVVCPPTLTGHWCYEVRKFCDPEDLNPLQYAGPPNTRARLQTQVSKFNLVVASYDIVRNDIEFFRSINWNYCILDEGHIIKNTKTKITKAVKQLKANCRLILSGTPIQNNVLELWSLFDFLMPGFLGTERQFYERFGKPILLSRDAKSSSKEQEAGALAMEALHRQVLPFMLRRMKEDVLQDLPPKIIQDYHCDLSPLQVMLYEDFAKSQAKREVEDCLEDQEKGGKKEGATQPTTHIFQALQYLRKVCNHPSQVVTPAHPLYTKVQEYLKKNATELKDIKHAAKLQALRQLLHDCGIGVSGEGGDGGEGVTSAVSQHRALIFCQYKSMLDIIQNGLFKVHMPSVTYLRLDGSVAPNARFGIVQKFNGDPSVDVLLLTTHVGGLGLNLTGADTVIFFEHDWNPMKDLQAMDRAHRVGQKKVVNVYRLITRGTLEEKIMSLQKFKLNIANTVISQENSSLLSMNTSELLDLFQLSEASEGGRVEPEGQEATHTSRGGQASMKSILENMPELWSEEQYTSEYDLSSFMQSLAAANKN